MNKSLSYFIFCILLNTVALAQKNFNQDFEKIDPGTGVLQDWTLGVGKGSSSDYLLQKDSVVVHSGRYSARLEPVRANSEFGAFSWSFPADFKGKTIQLKGYIKSEGVSEDGWAGLWMRLDGEGGVLGFDNMQQGGVHGTTDWKEYSIELDLDEEGKNIFVGGLLVGEGKVWFDDFEITVDGKPLSSTAKRTKTIFAAELDTVFAHNSQVELGKLDVKRIDDLVLLGQVWGFVKYHHPVVASGALNWDFELFRFLKKYKPGITNKERDQLLADWIKGLGDLSPCKKCDKKLEDVQLAADQSWMENPALGENLRAQLKIVYARRNQDKHHYISMAKGVGNPIFLHENAYSDLKYPDEGFRLLTVYRFWNMIHYFFPYRDVIGEDWTGVMKAFIPRLVQAKNALEYKLVTRELIGRIHDTHANLWMQDEELRAYFGLLRAPVQVRFIENQAVVTDYYHAELGPKTGLELGDVISSINGVSVASLVEQKKALYPASNMPTKLRDIARDLLRTNDSTLQVDIKRGEKTIKMTIPCVEPKSNKLMLSRDYAYHMPDSCYRFLKPDIGYLYLGNVKNDLLPDIMEKFKDTKGLVIDIRNYPSEFVVFTLGALLKSKASEFVYFTQGEVSNPGFFTKTAMISNGEANAHPYKGKIVILVNELSQSQAEYTAMALRSVSGAEIVGSTTAGADGNVSEFYLPGGLRSMISGIGVFYPDGTPTQRVGIVPDYTVTPTIAGVRAGRDELLEYALQLFNRP
jgi:C-terminal processing protease CtpA/Prc